MQSHPTLSPSSVAFLLEQDTAVWSVQGTIFYSSVTEYVSRPSDEEQGSDMPSFGPISLNDTHTAESALIFQMEKMRLRGDTLAQGLQNLGLFYSDTLQFQSTSPWN
jgi:hypothetical protein